MKYRTPKQLIYRKKRFASYHFDIVIYNNCKKGCWLKLSSTPTSPPCDDGLVMEWKKHSDRELYSLNSCKYVICVKCCTVCEQSKRDVVHL